MVTQFFEASPTGQVPWSVWIGPLGVWIGLALMLWLGMFCTVELFHRRWGEQEHLRYPLLYLPLELAGRSGARGHPFLRDPLMWLGFAAGFWYALPVVVSPLWPNFPDWKLTGYPFRALTSSPGNELASIYMRPLPHLIGLGYLMSSDNLLTIWATYLAQRLAWVAATAYGFRRPGWHLGGGLDLQQTLGAIVALFLWLMWSNRRTFHGAVTGPATPERWRVLGAVGGAAGAVWLGTLMGVTVGLALALVLLLNASSLVYARIRAEVGLPSYYAVPFEFQERDTVLDVLGSRTFRGDLGLAAISRFSVMGWMTQGRFPAIAAYHIENVELSRRSASGVSTMLWLSLCAALAGLAIGCWTHLTTFYDMGALSTVGAGGNGYYEVGAARRSYAKLLSQLNAATDFSLAPNLFCLAGGAIVLALAYLRGRYVGFPFTPWSYVIGSTYGTTFWTSFFMTWVAQKLILRYGGAQSYRRAIPFFLGISFGYMTATVAAVTVTFASGKALSFSAGKRLYFDI
ncbi:MAG: hypothetical protein HPY69_05650 [Armatimonadetes bacterium]|nr:hypothetical protein [Armatimonadota bacterium]